MLSICFCFGSLDICVAMAEFSVWYIIYLMPVFILYKVTTFILYSRYLPTSLFNDQYVLITGCDSGFGRMLVTQLDRKHTCRVFACCLHSTSVTQIRKTHSERVLPLLMDVSETTSVARAYKFVNNQVQGGAGKVWSYIARY